MPRCPKGSHRNKQTGECEPVRKTTTKKRASPQASPYKSPKRVSPQKKTFRKQSPFIKKAQVPVPVIKRYFINGLGCKIEDDPETIPFETVCLGDKAAWRSIYRLIRCADDPTIMLRKIENVNNIFREFYNRVLKEIQEGNRVYIYGASFGGLVVNILAVALQNEILTLLQTSNIYLAAFGSIYISPKEKRPDINLINYTAYGEFTQLCNRIKIKDDNTLFDSTHRIDCKPYGTYKYYKLVEKEETFGNIYITCYQSENGKEDYCKTMKSANRKVVKLITNWEVHNSYWYLFWLLQTNNTNDITTLRHVA